MLTLDVATPASVVIQITAARRHEAATSERLDIVNDAIPMPAQELVRAIGGRQLVAVIAGWPQEFRAGSRFRYSNTEYAILAHVIERASHQRHADFLRAAILLPLALHSTGYDDRPVAPAHATGYRTTGAPADVDHASVAFGAGAMYSTVEVFGWQEQPT
jgi:CubicO group peptidase (beta-lactamase class C family)